MKNSNAFQNEKAIKKILIVGGGTAGWMCAAALSKVLGTHCEITLVESDNIGTVGVGEATIPEILLFNAVLGIDEKEFIQKTNGTFKLGIEFVNWGKVGDAYFHPFGHYGSTIDSIQFYHYWQKLHRLGKAKDLGEYALATLASAQNKFMTPANIPNSPLSQIAYAYHFDAGLYAQYLRQFAQKRAVTRIEGEVETVTLREQDGFVESVTLKDHHVLDADLFIDCTGFRGLLIEGALNTGYDDWSNMLPCDSAVTVASEKFEQLPSYTRSTAHTAGWQWRIPLQHRTGNGHVYCSKYMSEDEATSILLENIEGEVLTQPRSLRFKTGMRRKFWNKNCVAIGLSSGFMEPLESTSIHLIQSSISKLLGLFPSLDFNPVETQKYNTMLQDEFVGIRDFLVLHYHATQRTDSPFWRFCKSMDISALLQRKIALYQSSGRVYRDNNELFDETSWLAVMHGQGLKAKAYHPLADARPIDEIEKQVENIRLVIERSAQAMPLQSEYIKKYCL